jgi:hypothetical protein
MTLKPIDVIIRKNNNKKKNHLIDPPTKLVQTKTNQFPQPEGAATLSFMS